MADLSLLIEDLPMQREVVAGIVILQREVKGMADLFLWIDDLPVQREEAVSYTHLTLPTSSYV